VVVSSMGGGGIVQVGGGVTGYGPWYGFDQTSARRLEHYLPDARISDQSPRGGVGTQKDFFLLPSFLSFPKFSVLVESSQLVAICYLETVTEAR
jgi:hypothetical protein